MHDISSSRVSSPKIHKMLDNDFRCARKMACTGHESARKCSKMLENARNGNYMFVGCITYLLLVRESNQISEYLIINI